MTIQFRAERDNLLTIFSGPARAAASRTSSLPVLTGLKVEAGGNRLAVTGTNLETTITTTGDAPTDQDGTCVLPGKLTTDIVRSLEPGVVTVTVTDDTCKIAGGRSNFDVRTLPADEYPRLNPVDTTLGTVIDGPEFTSALAQVVPAASNDDARPILTGVLLSSKDGNLRMVATDSYRLAIRDLAGIGALDGDDRLVPATALQEVVRLVGKKDKVRVIFEAPARAAQQVTFVAGDTVLTSVLIEGEFPPYERLIPQSHPNELTVDREHFVEVVARIALLAREATPVRLSMTAEGVEVRAVTQDVGEAVETVDGTYTGVDLVAAFNPVYMKAGLEACKGDTVTLHSIDALKPALLRSSSDPSYTYLLMPVRVS